MILERNFHYLEGRREEKEERERGKEKKRASEKVNIVYELNM